MSFLKKEFYDIYKTMESDAKSRIPELTDFAEGSVVRSLFEAFSFELGVLYEQMDSVYKSAFIDTANGSNLDRVVAVLGIKRNEPDYATGEVTFERDKGFTEKIVIPAGTVITTKENKQENVVRKVFITIEEGILDSEKFSVDVRVKAEIRGKDMITGADTVVIVPRPVPGVKTVSNKNPIRFIGKDGESDDELRSRAKQAILSAGRASVTSIENSLFSFPGIREVKVNEIFEVYKLTKNFFENLDGKLPKTIITKLSSIKNVEFINSTDFENTLIELIEKDNYLKYKTLINTNARFFNPGIIEIFVDGLNNENLTQIQNRIDEVRAAGVMTLIKPAIEEKLSAYFKIDVDEQVSEEDKILLESTIRDSIINYIDTLGLGDPLIFTQLTAQILNQKGVLDILDFKLVTYTDSGNYAEGTVVIKRSGTGSSVKIEPPQIITTEVGNSFQLAEPVVFDNADETASVLVRSMIEGATGELYRVGKSITWDKLDMDGNSFIIENYEPIVLKRNTYTLNDKRINIELFSRFSPSEIMIAAGVKERFVNIHIKLKNKLEDTKNLQNKIKEFIENLKEGETLNKNNIIDNAQLSSEDEVELFQKPHQKEKFENVFLVNTSILEKVTVDTIFIYHAKIELKGTMKIVLSLTATSSEKNITKAKVKELLKDYFDTLQPEEDVKFDKLRELVLSCDGVLRTEIEPSLFSLWRVENDSPEPVEKGITDEKISVNKGEKLFMSIDDFIIQD